jgi:hypothetical protein
MLQTNAKVKRHDFPLFTHNCLFLAVLLIFAVTSNATEDLWDASKYIDIDEIRPGMKAYCLTCYSGTNIDKFEMDVLSVVRNFGPGRNAILVQGTDERFIHTGPVWGCSGSPVYIEGRLAGALAFAYTYSKDPLYGVTPIREMLRVGQGDSSQFGVVQQGYAFDFSKPIDFSLIDKQISTPQSSRQQSQIGAAAMPCPLVTSGLPAGVVGQLNDVLEPLGFVVVSGVGGGGTINTDEDVKLAPGGCLAVPMVTGDITMEAVGTVTEVVGDKVYGFGHNFLGYGAVNLPMATGYIHTVVSSVARSVKLGGAIKIVGTLTRDESPAVYGQIGTKPHMFPLTITIDDYREREQQVYNCQISHNRLLAPSLLRSTVAGASMRLGDLPPEHTIEYQVSIGIEGAEPITFEDVSSDTGLNEMIMEGTSPVAMLMNNPYRNVNIKSVDFTVRISPKSIISHIWSVDVSDLTVKAGQNIGIEVVIESVLAGKKKYNCSLEIPQTLSPGKYELVICGKSSYEMFLRKAAPYRFVPQNLTGLMDALRHLLSIDSDKLYFLLAMPAGGVAIEKSELPDLPATKALLLQSDKRTLKIQPYQHWLEKTIKTGTVVIDSKSVQITVEE